jgi:hypothetical protein
LEDFIVMGPCRTGPGFVETNESLMVNGRVGYVAGHGPATREYRMFIWELRGAARVELEDEG